jgi:hypothetical protein
VADFDRASFADDTEVSLLRPSDVEGIHMPAGAHGVILSAWADGLAYEVEFDEPHVLFTVEASDLTA